MKPKSVHPSSFLAAGLYAVLLLAGMLEQAGRTTNDTKTPLIEAPGLFLSGTLSLWNDQLTLGELQNQAYGYLLPQGPFYLLAHLAHVAPWVSERLWSTLLLVVACEGARRVARAVDVSPWGALLAGFAYALNPRIISEVGVRSAEILPGVVLPWVLLPVVYAVTKRLGERRAALLSTAAFMFSGAVNGTATAAPLLLVAIVIGWAKWRGHVTWRLVRWWAGLVTVTSVWWAASLLKLNSYSPPFFDYVEDGKTTTMTTGFSPALRGASNWVNYIYTGGHPTWPAGFAEIDSPWLVLVSGLVAVVGVLGLVTWASPWRSPFVLAAAVGAACLVVGHSWTLQSPLSPLVQDLLDGVFALLRNVHKVDPVLRLPIALGVGVAMARAVDAIPRVRRSWVPKLLAVGLVVLTLGVAQPALALNLRSSGWDKIPNYWHQTADYLADAADSSDGDARAWVVPGSGFGIQTWGWTMDEPIQSVATTPWVARSQVPLVPPQTIRILSRLEDLLSSGSGSPGLGDILARMGIKYVVVRHDLDPTTAESTSANLVAIALSRSGGLTRTAQFGALDFGPAVEIYRVDQQVAPPIDVRPTSTAQTVASASTDVLDAVGQGLIEPDEAAVVQGDNGWDKPADIVGDSYRLRARNFGRVHDAEGPVLSPDEPTETNRIVRDYPANERSRPVYARYDGIRYVTASSSQGYALNIGATRPEDAPYSAVDGDPATAWRSAYYEDPVGQWLQVRYERPRLVGEVTVTSVISDATVGNASRWRIEAGGVHRDVDVNPFTGKATVDLGGVSSTTLRLTVLKTAAVGGTKPIAVSEIAAVGLPASRTLVIPPTDMAPDVDYAFSATPETRTCITTLLLPDCNFDRGRSSEESAGIDRTIEVPAAGEWEMRGSAIVRAQPGSTTLLDPFFNKAIVRASSTMADDPTVSPRLAYDGQPNTSWISDPYDPKPTLTVDFAKPTTINTMAVAQPASPAVSPTQAVLKTAEGQVRVVKLGGFGQFEPVRTKHLEITLSNPTRGLSPIGVGELYLAPVSIATPLDGAIATGAVCGYGPNLVVDGVRHPTRVTGFMGDVISAGPMTLEACDGPVRLEPGVHHVQILSTDQFQPVLVSLDSVAATDTPTTTPKKRSLTIAKDQPSRQELTVGPGEESILSTTRNFNRGWKATLEGATLPVLRVDGWAQGWRLPAGAGGKVLISYAPERSYSIVLISGLGVAAVVLLVALVALVRTRLGPVQPLAPLPRGRRRNRRRRPWVLALLGLAAPAWVVAGVPAAIACGVGAVLVGFGRSTVVAAAALLTAGAVAMAVEVWLDRPLHFFLPDLLTGVGFVLALIAAVDPPRRPWRT